MPKTRARWLLILFGIASIVTLVVLWPRASILPPSIASLELKQSLEGNEASAIIDRMHGKNVSARSNIVGIYAGRDGNATVYVSVYGSDFDAQEAWQTMQSRISRGSPAFTNYAEREVRGIQVSSCLGQGQAHYFFAHGKRVYWLATDGRIALQAFDDLVRKSVEGG